MPEYDAVVIGAGNGGLTGALTLAKAGRKVLLLERHNVPGGCATSFVRGRFEFEVALHQLSGMGSPERPGPLRSILGELGVLDPAAETYALDVVSV
ncbi:MAG TPA: FAD-dependent oxidoreductase, partial [Deltaproteobacteria bacterium]|nr:FAD-dependent oxidoreductase [Deltaproteobacteria bacterium]